MPETTPETTPTGAGDTGWTTMPAEAVQAGDRIRHRGFEFDVARITDAFLGRDGMICFIEDSPTRWQAYPAARTADVEVAPRS